METVVEQVPISQLRENPRNPRVNDQAVDAVARSIQAFGFNNPIITDGDLNVVAGHTRILAAQALGLESVPVIRAPHLTGSKFTGYAIADNQTATLATWDDGKLHDLVAELSLEDGFDLGALGFEDLRLDGLLVEGGDMEDALADIPSGERSQFEEMTFVVTHSQADEIKAALAVARKDAPAEDSGNKNRNGVALVAIARAYVL